MTHRPYNMLFRCTGNSARSAAAVPFAVAAYITGAYWFTSSTSFANPAVTLARAATNTFAGIRPGRVDVFAGAAFGCDRRDGCVPVVASGLAGDGIAGRP